MRESRQHHEFKFLPLKNRLFLVLGLTGLPIMLLGQLTDWSWYRTAAETWPLPPGDVLKPVFLLLFFLLMPVPAPNDPDRRPLDYLPWVARIIFAWTITAVALYEIGAWMGWVHGFS